MPLTNVRLFDFTGGLNTRSAVTSLTMKEARDTQNINILPSGGFEKRRGNTAFNSSAMASGAAVHGLTYFRLSDGTDFLVAVCGTSIFSSPFDGTMTDRVGAATITTGQDNIWNFATLNDTLIAVGGPDGTFNTPLSWGGSGDVAALAGSPPSGGGVIVTNNRAFIFDITSNRSRIQWSILGSPIDWTGVGSGSQDVAKNDGDTLVAASSINIDHMLLFKQNSIWDLATRAAPFPLFPLFRDVGAISRRGVVYVDGLLYFITPQPRMKATDGSQVFEFPDTIDDVWDSLVVSRLKFIHGLYYKRLHQIWWFVTTTGGTHDQAIIWDLKRKCWLRNTTGYKMNASTMARDRTAYAGAYAGKIYQQDVAVTYTDASETSPGAINAYWRTGWNDFGDSILAKTPQYSDLNFTTQNLGTFDFKYGFDFVADRKSETISMSAGGAVYGTAVYGTDTFGGQSDRTQMIHMLGSGKFIQFLLRNQNASESFSFNGISSAINTNEPRALR